MPIYLNGQKYNGAYMNGQRVNGYINGVKLFHYMAPFTIRYAPDNNVVYSKTVQVPSDHSYSIYDLENYGVPSAFEEIAGSSYYVGDQGYMLTDNPTMSADNYSTWPGGFYNASGMADPFPDIDNTMGGGNYTIYESPYTGEVMTSRDSEGMLNDTSTIAVTAVYYDTDGNTWCFGRCDLHNSSGMGGNGSTWVGTGWVKNPAGLQLTSSTPANMAAKLGITY